MSESLTIPSWVPDGVRHMYEVGPLKNEFSRRLLTDKRMKAAWTELRKLVPADDAPTPSYYPPSQYMQQRLRFIAPGCSPEQYGDLGQSLTDFDRLSAALYYVTVIPLSQVDKSRKFVEPPIWTAAKAAELAKPYLDAVKLCEASIEAESLWRYGDPPRLMKEDLVNALKSTRDYLSDQAQMYLMRSNPRVLDRSRGQESDRLRAHARSIAVAVRDLFGPFASEFPHATVGRIAVVSLGRTNAIDKAFRNSVARWCETLPAPISTTA